MSPLDLIAAFEQSVNRSKSRKRRHSNRNRANGTENRANSEKYRAARRARNNRPAKSEQRRKHQHSRPRFALETRKRIGKSFADILADKRTG